MSTQTKRHPKQLSIVLSAIALLFASSVEAAIVAKSFTAEVGNGLATGMFGGDTGPDGVLDNDDLNAPGGFFMLSMTDWSPFFPDLDYDISDSAVSIFGFEYSPSTPEIFSFKSLTNGVYILAPWLGSPVTFEVGEKHLFVFDSVGSTADPALQFETLSITDKVAPAPTGGMVPEPTSGFVWAACLLGAAALRYGRDAKA